MSGPRHKKRSNKEGIAMSRARVLFGGLVLVAILGNARIALPAGAPQGGTKVSQAISQSAIRDQSTAAPTLPVLSNQSGVPGQSRAPARKASSPAARARYLPAHFPRRAQLYYQDVWGVDSLRVKTAESGEIIRFSWRVLDPARAAALNDKKVEPELIDPKAGVKLVVPKLENVGTLRQSGTPVADKSYWMAFSNSGRRVRPGDHVIVAIGQFHAENLVVE
jgi:hypothetical protein